MDIQDDILDVSRLHLTGDFNNQVDYLLQQIRLTRNEVENLSNLFSDLEVTLQKAWPGCEIFPFGSIVTGLGIRTSDVDCYVSLPYWITKTQASKSVMKAKRVLGREYTIFSQLFAIPNAKVPIVKFYHIPNARHCDVNFKSLAGVENSRLLAYLLHADNRVLPLAIVIKYWSKVHNITGTNLVPNYGLTLLVIFYLQQCNMLPPVSTLQKSVPEKIIDHWNIAFDTPVYVPDNDDSLYQLMGGFFQYYSDFDFDSFVLSPFLGYAIDKTAFKRLADVPPEFDLYKKNVVSQVCKPIKLDNKICVQDPFEHGRNCFVGVYPKLAMKLLAFFANGAKHFKELPNDRFLRAIITRGPETKEFNKKNHNHNRVIKQTKVNAKKIKQNIQNKVHLLYGQFNKLKRGKR